MDMEYSVIYKFKSTQKDLRLYMEHIIMILLRLVTAAVKGTKARIVTVKGRTLVPVWTSPGPNTRRLLKMD